MDGTNPIPYGFCQCGCGRETTISAFTCRARGYVKGQPRFYVRGHAGCKAPWRKPSWHLDDRTGCWLWDGAVDGKGYGRFYDQERGRSIGAYRWVYEQRKGPVSESLELDHLCRVPLCVNPDHLEPVTARENQDRGIAARGKRGCISYAKDKGRWRAVVTMDGRQHYVGYFDTHEEGRVAMDAYLSARGLLAPA